MIKVTGVRFRQAGKVYYFDPKNLKLERGSHVIVETARGIEYGTVIVPPKGITDDEVVQPLKAVIRVATPEDDRIEERNHEKEKEAYKICLEKIEKHGLAMKLVQAEYTFDNNKLLFYFTADGRIDFRELVKDLASVFRTRIELRQIGVRDETKILGGIGIMSPVGQYVREKKHVYVGIALSGVMLLAVAGSILTSLGTYPEAVQAELPMVALASRLNGTLGTIYGIMLLVAMFCNALASLVGMSAYVEQKSAFVRTHKNTVLLAVSVLAWAASLLGFAEIIGTVYPIFGYISIAFLVFLVIHFFRAKKMKQPQQA